jgi:hypothetical protein
MSNRASFSDNCEAITHDSDIRKLTFVQRGALTGEEVPIGVSGDYTTLLLANAASQDWPIFTKPYEIRNRNKASFNLKFTPPTDTVTYADGNPQIGESLVNSAFQYDSATWGFTTDAQTVDSTPGFLLLDPAEIPGSANDYMDSLRIEIDIPFSGEPYIGETVVMQIIDPNLGTVFTTIDLMTDGIYDLLPGVELPIDGQQLVARITTSAVAGLDNFAAGHAIVSRHSYGFTNSRHYFNLAGPASDWNLLPGMAGTKNIYFSNIPTGGKLTRVRAVIDKAFVATPGASMTMVIKAEGNTVLTLSPNNPGPGTMMLYDSGVVSQVMSGNLNRFTATLTMDTDLANLTEGLITFIYDWEVVASSDPFVWSADDQLQVLAFVSLDDIQYTPIAMARHDWSNTPFVDITKFEPFEIPSDFDPAGGYPPGIPPIDNIAFRNSIMLFMSDFDNASTWNYIRFLIAWVPQEASANGGVYLEITANAREL